MKCEHCGYDGIVNHKYDVKYCRDILVTRLAARDAELADALARADKAENTCRQCGECGATWMSDMQVDVYDGALKVLRDKLTDAERDCDALIAREVRNLEKLHALELDMLRADSEELQPYRERLHVIVDHDWFDEDPKGEP